MDLKLYWKLKIGNWKLRVRGGFTLMELLIVISLLGILSTIAFTSYQSTQKNARDSRRKSDLEQVRQALELYRTDNGTYPTTGGGSWTDLSNLEGVLVTDYIDQLSDDPKIGGFSYRYRATDASGINYYGYCISAVVELNPPTSSPCTPDTGYNYSVRNP